MTCHNKTPNRILVSICALAFVAMSYSFGLAQDSNAPIDEKAIATLKEMSNYLGESQTMSFHINSYFDMVQKAGTKIKVNRASKVLLKRPNQLNIQAEGDDGSAVSIWYDGSKLTMWMRDINQVMSDDIEGTTDAMLDHLIDKFDVQLPLSDLFYTDVSTSLTKEIESATYVGIRLVDGIKCHHLFFRSPDVDWQIWIEADATPVPRRFAMDFIGEDNDPQYMANMTSWSIGGELGDFNFVAAVPESVKKVDFNPKP